MNYRFKINIFPSSGFTINSKLLAVGLVFFAVTSLFSEITEVTLPDTLRKYQLEGIRVIAEKPQETIGSLAVKSFNPQQPATELTIAEAVNDVPGLDTTTGGKSGTDLRIRGFANDQIKFMLDGRPLGGGYFGNVDLSTIPVSEIKEIQVLKGPVSSLYGTDTMGGVVNIITRPASNKKWLKAGIQAKRNNTNKLYVTTSHDLGDWDFWLYVSRFHTDGFVLSRDFQPTPYENGAIRNFTGRNQYDFQSKINFTLFDFHSLGFQAGYTFMDKKEIPSSIYESRLRDFTEWQRFQLSGMGSFQLSPYLKSNVNIYYDSYQDTYAEYDPVSGEMYAQWPSYLESWIFGINQKNNWELNSDLQALFGYRFEKEVYNRKDNGNYSVWTSNNQIKHNGFAQFEYEFGNLTFSGGSGISFFRPKGKKSWQANPEPALGIYWEDLFKSSLAFSSNTRYPNMHELFSASSGNLNLQEQRAEKYEFTTQIPLRTDIATGSFSCNFYYNNIRNLIDKVGDVYQNIYKVQNFGTECSLNLKIFWEHEIDYAYIKYLDKSNLSLLEVPQNTVNIAETAELPGKIKLRYKANWKDLRSAENEVGQIVFLEAYWLHSLYLSKNWKNVKFVIGIENIFDKNYMEKYGYPGPGINFLVNLEVEL